MLNTQCVQNLRKHTSLVFGGDRAGCRKRALCSPKEFNSNQAMR